MLGAATFPSTGLRHTLRRITRQKIVDTTIAHPKIAVRRIADKTAVRKTTVAPSAIGPIIPTRRTSTTITIGWATIPAAATRTITWIIPGNMAASQAALAAAMSTVWEEGTASAFGLAASTSA